MTIERGWLKSRSAQNGILRPCAQRDTSIAQLFRDLIIHAFLKVSEAARQCVYALIRINCRSNNMICCSELSLLLFVFYFLCYTTQKQNGQRPAIRTTQFIRNDVSIFDVSLF